MHTHTWKGPEVHQIWTVNQASQNNRSKETEKKCPIKVIPTATRARFRDSLSEPAVCLSTCTTLFFPLSKHSTCFTTFHLCGNCFLQSWRPSALMPSLVARIGASTVATQLSLCLGTQALFQAAASWSHLTVTQSDSVPVIEATSVPAYCYFSRKLVRFQAITILSLISNA